MEVQLSATLRVSLPESIDVFISARFDGGAKEKKARELYEGLKRRNKLKPFMVDAVTGDDFGNWTDRALHRAHESNGYCLFRGLWSKDWKSILYLHRDYDGKDLGAAQNSSVFDLGVGYGSDWSSKQWNANDECAKEVEQAFLRKFGKTKCIQPQEIQSAKAANVDFDLSASEIQTLLVAKKSNRPMSKKKKLILVCITFLVLIGIAIGVPLGLLLKKRKNMSYYLNGAGNDDLFGSAIAMSSNGGTVVIGSPETYDEEGKGYVKVYSYDVDGWELKGFKFEGDLAGDEFGKSVSISYNGNIIAIGSPRYGRDFGGRVYVYVFDKLMPHGSSWAIQ
ncbi:hypothetical protein CTEN210_12993 [Chaetoceros tenuissimus]|uniref:Uncharacterized protein n=1 Tax=Chaetoceros tenuissimus TaxID=426638 RepID=A0AAD3D276_9STRA|nr:hypothetical protein CTEN210_12993 [Chaetoceros tenuissimus]